MKNCFLALRNYWDYSNYNENISLHLHTHEKKAAAFVTGQVSASVHSDCQCFKYFPVSFDEEIHNRQSTWF